MTTLISRNTTIPTAKTETFTTAADNQPSVEVHAVQGERPMAADNKSIGRFMLDGILPAQRGIPQIEVTFDIDANGIINVSAKDKGTGKEQRITITASSGLSKEDIDKLVEEAEQFSEEDQKRKQEVETKNIADSTVYAAEKLVQDNEDKIDSNLKEDLETKITKLKESIQSENVDSMNEDVQALQVAMQQVGQAIYSQSESENTAATDEDVVTEEDSNDDTVEGEYREV